MSVEIAGLGMLSLFLFPEQHIIYYFTKHGLYIFHPAPGGWNYSAWSKLSFVLFTRYKPDGEDMK